MALKMVLTRYFSIGAVIILSFASESNADSFTDDLQLLQKQNVQKVGRDALVKGYEQLLKDHPTHPDRAKAMLALASLWQFTDPGLGIKADSKEEIRWLREACKNAAEGSDDWFKSRFWLEGEICIQHPDEANRILDDLMQHAPDDVVKVRSLFNKQVVAVDQKHLREAEAIFLRLQDWDIHSNDMPKEMFKKGKVFQQIQSSARLMMMTTAGLNIPKAERKAKIEELVDKCRHTKHAQMSAEAALQYMEELPDVNWRSVGGGESGTTVVPDRGGKSSLSRKLLLGLNAVVLGALAVWLAIRRIRRKQHV